MPIFGSPHPEGQPSGGMLHGGAGAAPCGRVCTPDSGGCGNRPGRTTAPVRGASLGEAARWLRGGRRSATRCGEPACPVRSRSTLRPTEARPAVFKNADKRSATGRADGGSIHPRRILAQRKRLSIHRASRRSAAPHLKRTRRRGRRRCMREPQRKTPLL